MPRLRGGGVVLAALLVSMLVGVGPVIAGPIDKAKAAIEQSDYFSARSALDEGLRSGTNKPDDLAEIYRLSGYVAAALGDAAAAKAAFERCLALAPTSALPAGTSPRIIKSFIAAQDTFKTKKPLEIKTETAAEPPKVTIQIVEDPLKMIAKVQATFVVDGKPEQKIEKPLDKPGKVTVDLPKGNRIDLRVAALDEYGNRLAELGSKSVPIVIVGKSEQPAVVVGGKPPPKPKPVKPFVDRPLYLRWWLWAGTAAVVLGAGSYFGIEAIQTKGELQDLNNESANHSFDEAQALESRARRNVLLANIGLIAGGTFALGAGVLWLIRPKRPKESRERTSIAPVVHTHGGGLVLGGHF